jgi:hypothetical protein
VTLTNATGLPVSTGISGLGTNVATALAVNVGSSGAFVTNGGALGTPSSGTLTNATGLPISTGVSGLGTNVATALAVNVGSSGAFVTNGGALGTPSSGTVTNLTGTASININGTVGATTPTTGAFTTLTTSSTVTHNGGTADQVQYLNASKVLSGSSNFTFDGSNLQIGSQGDLRFGDSDNSNWVGFQAPASVTTNITWTLPSADGSNGQVLSTNGSGTLSWTTAGGGGGISAGKSIAFAMVFGG